MIADVRDAINVALDIMMIIQLFTKVILTLTVNTIHSVHIIHFFLDEHRTDDIMRLNSTVTDDEPDKKEKDRDNNSEVPSYIIFTKTKR